MNINSERNTSSEIAEASQVRGARILRMKQLIKRTGLSRATLYVLIATEPTFARKIQLSARTIGFYEHEVDAWIASRAQMQVAS